MVNELEKEMKIEIIGDGTVGKALGKNMGITPLGPSEDKVNADIVIICVPTETINGKQDQSNVEQALGRIEGADLVIIRSTILPGTTDRLQRTTDIPLMFIPEFGFEQTMIEDLKRPDFYVVGVTDKSKDLVHLALNLPNRKGKCVFHTVRAISAEFAKYFINIWGSSQVILANSYYDWVISRTGNGDIYEEAIGVAKNFKNLPKWGWRIHDQGFRGYGGKCLPKDTQAAISQYASPLWQEFERYNQELKVK
jgi:UDPglucose 6-dehydrogenase